MNLHRIASEAAGYLDLGLPEEALEVVRMAAREHPGVADAQAIWLSVANRLERWSEMEEAGLAWARCAPGEPEPGVMLAFATRRAHDLEAAARVLEDVVHRHPAHGLALFNLACYRSVQGRLEEGFELLRRAVAVDPSFLQLAAADPDLEALRPRLALLTRS